MKKQCGFLLLYVVVAVLLLPLLLTMLCGGLGQELPQEAQALYGLADLAPLDTELEEYVAGVVAAEMPAAFPEEALKAQAVAARTYQVRQMQAQEAGLCFMTWDRRTFPKRSRRKNGAKAMPYMPEKSIVPSAQRQGRL